MRVRLSCMLALLLLLLTASAQAPQPLTNADVLELIHRKVSADLVVHIIQAAPGHYDTSAASLNQLRSRGATQTIVDAVSQKNAPALATMSASSKFKRPNPLLANSAAIAANSQLEAFTARARSIQPEICEEDGLDTVEDCHSVHRTGCSHSQNPGYDAYLNFLKNIMPTSVPQDAPAMSPDDLVALDTHLPDTLNSRNHGDHASELATIGEGNIVKLVGTLDYAFISGSETCNCQMSGDESVVDYHIGIGSGDFPAGNDVLTLFRGGRIRTSKDLDQNVGPADKAALQQGSVVVEMTPFYRVKHPENGWSLDKLDKATGHKVRVTGQVMVDNAHLSSTQDCALSSTAKERKSCWRASVWEVHPVLRFEVCHDATCTADSNDWVELKDFQ
jgi:hypothetical protein